MDEKLAHQLLLFLCTLVRGSNPNKGLLLYLSIIQPHYMLYVMSHDPDAWLSWVCE